MTYSPYGEIKELDEEEQLKVNAKEDQLNEMSAAVDYQAQEQAIAEGTEAGPTLEQTPGQTEANAVASSKPAAKPLGDKQAKQKQTSDKPQKQVPGWGADPKPEDRWNIRDRAPAKSEMEGMVSTSASEAVLAPAVGTLDGFVGLYNTVTPGPDIPKIPQFQDENLTVIREVSSFIGPQLVGVGLIDKGAKAAQAARLGPAALQKLGTNPIFQLFATTGADMGVGAVVDTALSKPDDSNLQQQIRDALGTPENERLFGLFPSSWSTGTTDNPDEKAARIRNEGMGLGLFSGIAEGIVKMGAAIADTNAATKFLPKNVAEQEYLEKIAKGDQFTNIKYSDDPIQDAVMRSEARAEYNLDELGEYYVARKNADNIAEGKPFQTADELEFEGPVKGIHDSFDQLETGVINADPAGVPGAMVDAARIKGDIQTANGRLGSMTTEGALKYGLEVDNLQKGLLVSQIQDRITKSGKFDYLLNGKLISAQKIDDAGTWLAEEMINMNPGEMNTLLDGFRKMSDDLSTPVVNNVGYDAVMKSLKTYMDTFLNMDAVKARAFLTTSYAGQASDLAGEWAKVSDGAAVTSARNMIMDRMEFLMVNKALASYDSGAALQGKNVWDRIMRLGQKKEAKDFVLEQVQAREKFLGQIVPNVKGFTTNLIQIMEEKPQFMKPLFDAYHLTDGKVSSMYDLNKYVYENLAAVQQAFVRGEDTMPNLIVSGMYSNYYNSILSATATPIRAMVGNLGGIIARPLTTMAGALMEFDTEAIMRASYQYAGVKDAMVNGYKHMSHFWKKTLENPMSTMEYGRGDLAVVRNDKNIEVLRTTANAMAKDGHYGPEYLLNQYEDMHAIATNPWFRYSANMMGAADAFTRAVIATAEARGMAYDKVLKPGTKVKPGDFKKVADEAYSSMHNSKGWISDTANDYYTGEIALNLDSPLSRGMSSLIQSQPWLKPILLFPRTSINVLSMFAKYSPLGMISKDFWDLVKYGDQPPLQHVQEVLSKKGIQFDENAMQTFNQMRREAKGRIAIGSLTTVGISTMFSEDRIRGTGHWDKERQRVRTDNGWVGKTYKGLDGKWHSYEWLGPIGDWVSIITDIRDNFDLISTAKSEFLIEKMGYILASAVTDRSLMAQVEPLGDIMAGNGAAANRFAANMINGAAPMGGLRNTFSRLMSEGMKEVDNELTELIRNKNNYLDPVDANGALGTKWGWVDHEPIGFVEGWAQRAANAFLGHRMGEKMTPNKQFLIDIEYDSRPAMTKVDGIELTSQQRSKIFDKMGELGTFSRALTTMRTTKGEAYLRKMKEFREKGVRSSQIESEEYMSVHTYLDKELRKAAKQAMAHLDAEDKAAIRILQTNKSKNDGMSRRGTITMENMYK